ncbi:pfs domain-containing protein [Colletotrichum kahawae]|uniref:Pfs domain-containing protein n=1 Tax=Colletotrichum kahawae TaxID=34407 RepID=A0AAE0D404_COLKA|nr:pfs domain-containing protein [Colletotrichum kahawae]
MNPHDGRDLHEAVEKNQFNRAKDILAQNPFCVDGLKDGWTPLHRAAKCGHERLVVLLLEHDAAVNCPTQNSNASPLILAADRGSVLVLSRLIKWGADLNQAANDRRNNDTPLHRAATLEKTGPLHLLLLRGSAVNPVNGEGKTPLDMAVQSSHSANETILKEFGGLTGVELGRDAPHFPLHGIRSRILNLQLADFVDRSAQKGHGGVVELLLDSDADIMLETRHGSNARMLGVRGKHQTVVGILDKYAKKQRQRGFVPVLPHGPASGQAERKERMVTNRKYRLRQKNEYDSSGEEAEADGHNGRIYEIKPDFVEHKPFTLLNTTYKNRCQFQQHDTPVKIAVIDTGLDLKNGDLNSRRVESFFKNKQGDLGVRLAKDDATTQLSRVTGRINFARNIRKAETDVQDLDGHRTRVAAIILRLVPTAQLYVARVCDGNVRDRKVPAGDVPERSATSRNVAKAIDWAIEQKVDMINLSFGFSSPDEQLKSAARRARDAGIIIFASMSIEYSGLQEWPGNEFSVAIGISASKAGSIAPSEFSPPVIRDNPNFIVAGERIVTPKFPYPRTQDAKVSDRFELATGSSYATAVATSMGALMVGFIKKDSCKDIRRETSRSGPSVTHLLKKHKFMAMLLKEVGKPTMEYHWINPTLLWADFKPPKEVSVAEAAQEHAWDVIRKALRKWQNQS